MTVTDRAFIRAFDHRGEPAEYAPHVVFAARGINVSAAAAAEAVVERRGPAAEKRPALRPSPGPSREDTPPPATSTVAAPPPPGQMLNEQDSQYLPSLYRSLVGLDPEPAEAVATAEPALPLADVGNRGFRQRIEIAETTRQTPISGDLRPALEVDTLRWPAVVEQLLRQHSAELSILCDALEQAMRRQERVIAFQSTGRAAGCTTMSLVAARQLVDRGYSVALVDADLQKPSLASSVGLAIDEGWERSLLWGADLAESVIHSLADRVAIVPLARLAPEQLMDGRLADRMGAALRLLAETFDVVLADAGCVRAAAGSSGPRPDIIASASDSCVLIHAQDPHSTTRDVPQFEMMVPLIGVVENLVAARAA